MSHRDPTDLDSLELMRFHAEHIRLRLERDGVAFHNGDGGPFLYRPGSLFVGGGPETHDRALEVLRLKRKVYSSR